MDENIRKSIPKIEGQRGKALSQQRLPGTHGKKHSNNGNKKLTIMHEGERVSISDTFPVLSITILPMSSL